MPPRWNENRLTAKLGSTIPSFKVPSADCHHKIDGGGLELWRTRIVRCARPDAGSDQRGNRGDSLPYIETVAMNLWVSMEDEGARTSDENAFKRSLRRLHPSRRLGSASPTFKPYSPARLKIRLACC